MFLQNYIIGLLGKTLKHSFSKDYFTKKIINNNFSNFEYKNFEIPQIDLFPLLVTQNENILGLNVTIPYKQDVLKFVDKKSYEVEIIGATNTLVIERKNNKTIISAYNTDIYGFEVSLRKFLDRNIYRALVLGNGGASKAVCFVLEKLRIQYSVIARNRKAKDDILFEDVNKGIIQNVDLIVNTTPVGQYPNVLDKLNFPFEYITKHHYCFDLIYNPTKTFFLEFAENKGAKVVNGLEMLYLQAEKSWELFYNASKNQK